MKDKSRDCPYCGWSFVPTLRHRAESVTPFCSHGCKLAKYGFEVSNQGRKGRSVVSLDAMRPAAAEAAASIRDEYVDNLTTDEQHGDVHDAIRHFARSLLALRADERDILLRRIIGQSLPFIAAHYRTTKQNIDQRIRRSLRNWPALRHALPFRNMKRNTLTVDDVVRGGA